MYYRVLEIELIPIALGLLWIAWVFGSLKDDIAELRETYDGVRKGMLVAVWVLTLPVAAFVVWWGWVLIHHPYILAE